MGNDLKQIAALPIKSGFTTARQSGQLNYVNYSMACDGDGLRSDVSVRACTVHFDSHKHALSQETSADNSHDQNDPCNTYGVSALPSSQSR